MDKWQPVKLKDIADYSRERIGSDKLTIYNYISTENMLPEKAGKTEASSLPTGNAIKYNCGQTLVSNIRPYFKKIWYASNDGGCSADILAFRISEQIDSKYFYYLLSQDAFFDYMMAGSKGTKMPRGDKQQIMQYPFLLPPLPEQKAIADTLSCLDDKIELNNKINHHIEQMAQAIFKSWFVDFEPFQDGEFVDSELGRIPKGWRVGTLGEIANITMGQSPSGSSYNENGDGTVFYQGRAEFGWRFPTRRLFTTEPKRMATKGDVLMSVRAPVGDLNVADEDCCIGRGLAAIQGKFGYSSFVLYTMFNLKSRLDMFNGEGTVFGSINKDSLNTISVIIANNETLKKFEEAVKPLDDMIENNHKENCHLHTVQDSLLPRLMSGEIDVSDVNAK